MRQGRGSPQGKPTGLLGGSFNPAHGGHRSISLFAIDALELDELWWLVSPGNPLKPNKDMAPLPARLASARFSARRSRIRPTAIERELGTRYTVDTLRRIKMRYPKRQFIWIMGADNLAQFVKWRRWRDIAAMMPIAVIARPGYDADAMAGPAMAWFRRFVRRSDQRKNWTKWSTPALVYLRFRPDPRSATAVRSADPHWFKRYEGRGIRDAVTRTLVY
ncbi:nicotinate-nucleotide adenylyltransferase [Sphingorhabdus arenilitoris]|uniref:Probable nicotinate-nucleotide adenylyltransferase n=1 Tax=Sphingorhabdus arenilitoris TaxID=1490041 RepID=A0ABV8RJ11_9SPHN